MKKNIRLITFAPPSTLMFTDLLGGFPIEIETKISKLITYRLAIFIK